MLKWFNMFVLPVVGAWGIRLLGKTMTLATVGGGTVDAFIQKGMPIIIAFWHGRGLMMPLAYRGKSASLLVSRHRDGEIIANIMKEFGVGSIRGSSSRGGMQALRQLVATGRQGQDLVVTPDGPRGPACHVQMGVIYLAKLTGFPIVPLTFACSKKKVVSSWDQFQIPYPSTKGLFVWGDPVWVASTVKKDEMGEYCADLQRVLNTLTERAERAVQQPDPASCFLRIMKHDPSSVVE
jgi:lysophospholipid acyltransferase (LPLAT)-like uncharacterized protein